MAEMDADAVRSSCRLADVMWAGHWFCSWS